MKMGTRKVRGLRAAVTAAFAVILFVLIVFISGRDAREVSGEAEPAVPDTSLYEIPAEEFAKIREAAGELITDRVAAVHMRGVEITGLSCDGWCLVETSGAEEGDPENALCVIYTVEMDADVSEYGVEDQFAFYTYVEFEDVVIEPDGTLRADPEQAAITYREYKHPFDTTSSSTPVIYGYYHGYGSMGDLIAHIGETGTILDSRLIRIVDEFERVYQ